MEKIIETMIKRFADKELLKHYKKAFKLQTTKSILVYHYGASNSGYSSNGCGYIGETKPICLLFINDKEAKSQCKKEWQKEMMDDEQGRTIEKGFNGTQSIFKSPYL